MPKPTASVKPMDPAAKSKVQVTQTPTDRRNLANRMAGWPVKG